MDPIHPSGWRAAAADPFRERHIPAMCRQQELLGGRFRFESDSEALLELVDAAYGGLPPQRRGVDAPTFRVELRLSPARPGTGASEPPPVRTHSGAGLLFGTMDACNHVVIVPARREALVTVSADMLAHAYHVRYELIEFAVFVLAARGMGLVPLHGACIGGGGHGVLLLGPSGAGKSTLALHALGNGLDFLSEDAVFVHPGTMVATGIGNFVHVKADALRFLDDAKTRQWIADAPVIRRRSGVRKYEADLRKGPRSPSAAPLRLVGAVFVSDERADDPDDLLAPVGAPEAAAWLAADQPYAAAQPGWDVFVGGVVARGVHRLRRGRHPRDALDALRQRLAADVAGV